MCPLFTSASHCTHPTSPLDNWTSFHSSSQFSVLSAQRVNECIGAQEALGPRKKIWDARPLPQISSNRLGQKSETNPVFQWFPLPAGPALFYPWCGPLLTRSVANLMLPFIPVKEKKTQIRTLITALVPFETLEGW